MYYGLPQRSTQLPRIVPHVDYNLSYAKALTKQQAEWQQTAVMSPEGVSLPQPFTRGRLMPLLGFCSDLESPMLFLKKT